MVCLQAPFAHYTCTHLYHFTTQARIIFPPSLDSIVLDLWIPAGSRLLQSRSIIRRLWYVTGVLKQMVCTLLSRPRSLGKRVWPYYKSLCFTLWFRFLLFVTDLFSRLKFNFVIHDAIQMASVALSIDHLPPMLSFTVRSFWFTSSILLILNITTIHYIPYFKPSLGCFAYRTFKFVMVP